jgi:hypothetical protein
LIAQIGVRACVKNLVITVFVLIGVRIAPILSGMLVK